MDIRAHFFVRFLVLQGDVGFAAGLSGEDLGQVRVGFHGQDRELHPEAGALEEKEQVVRNVKFPRGRENIIFSRPLRVEQS